MKNTILFYLLLFNFQGFGQLKFPKWRKYDIYVPALLQTNNSNVKSVKINFTKDSSIAIFYNQNQSVDRYEALEHDVRDETHYFYDEKGYLIKVAKNYQYKNENSCISEKTYYRGKDSMFVLDITQNCYGTFINSVAFEIIDNVRKIKASYTFQNDICPNPKSYLDSTLLKKISCIDSAKISLKKGCFKQVSYTTIFYDDKNRPIKEEYCEPIKNVVVDTSKGIIKGSRPCGRYEFYTYTSENKGFSRYVNPRNYNNYWREEKEIQLNANNEIQYLTGLILAPIDDYNEPKTEIKNIHIDKKGNWTKRKYYDVIQQKWIIQHRKIKYW